MKALTGIGIAGAFTALLLSVLMDGGNPVAFISIPAFIVVIGGTAAATAASSRPENFMAIPKLAILALKGNEIDMETSAQQMIRLAEKARREGLLALENDLRSIDDAYLRKGLQLIVDGAPSELVEEVLQAEMDIMGLRHGRGANVFAIAGGFAPTLGILGTVLGLVHVLGNLSSPGELGKSIAGAFLATLYGVGSANLIFLPIGNKLKSMSEDESDRRAMLLEAILSIQAGGNPRLLGEKLEAFLPPDRRGKAQPLRAVKEESPEPTAAAPEEAAPEEAAPEEEAA